MALFALPKTLTDLVKAFKSAASGRVLRKGPAGWEFLDPSQTWASQGIFVGTAEPELVSYAQWAATGEGYWAWVDVSSAVGSTEVFSVGGAVLAGSSPVAASRPVLSSGGAILSGSPLTSCGVLTAGSGGPVLSGSATISMGSAGSVIVSSMGGIVSGGVSVPLRGVVALPAGGAVLSGSALSAKGSATASAGGAVLSGTASVAGSAGAAQVSVASAGGAVLSGAAAQSSERVSVASGGVVMSGSASVEGAGAFTPVNVSDDFNRADGGLGSNWTTLGGAFAPLIVSQRVTKGGQPEVHAAYWSTDTFAADQWAIARVYPETLLVNEGVAIDTLTAGPSVRAGGLGYHVSATNFNDIYDTQLTGFTVTLWKNGVRTEVYYSSETTNEYTHLKITAVSSTVTVYGGQSASGPWTELMIYTDPSPIASGSAGIVIGPGSYATLDDWSGGTV